MSQTSFGRMLIAGTDENGHVSCVWVKRRAAKHARPVKNAAEFAQRLSEFEVVNAARDGVGAWLNVHS
jgi:hypothetical protein